MLLKNRPVVRLVSLATILGATATVALVELNRKPGDHAPTRIVEIPAGPGQAKPEPAAPLAEAPLRGVPAASVDSKVLDIAATEADLTIAHPGQTPETRAVAADSVRACLKAGETAAAEAQHVVKTSCQDANLMPGAEILSYPPSTPGQPARSVFTKLPEQSAGATAPKPAAQPAEPAPPLGMDYQVLQIAPQNGPFTLDASDSSGTDKDGFRKFHPPVTTPTIEACLQAARQQARTGAVDFDCSDATQSPVVSGHMTRTGGTFQLDAPDPRIPQFWNGNQAAAVSAAQDEWKQLLGKYSTRNGLARTPQ